MSVKINVYNQEAKVVGEVELSDKVFALEANSDLIHQALVAQMSNERQVLAHTKTKSEVRGGGKKPWKQKGTGRARAGSSRSPIWVGGGVTFGPRKDRNFTKKINKKMKQRALMMVFSDRAKNDSLIVVDKLEMGEFKTSKMDSLLKGLEANFKKNEEGKIGRRNVLIINSGKSKEVLNSARNLPGVEVINLENINIVDLLAKKNFILSQEAAKKIDEIYSKE
jgi:large subunit ribosomal protein L4